MSGSYNIQPSEKTGIIRGRENVLNALVNFATNTKSRIDVCLDQTRPALAVEIGELLADVKGRGINLRVLAEITTSNIAVCKKLKELVGDLRHLDGIKGTFYTNEKEYLAPAVFHEEGKAASQMVYINIKELVEQQQYFFDTLWFKSIRADEKIKSIEEGVQPQFVETVSDPYQVHKLGQDLARSAREEVLILFSTANAFLRQWKVGLHKTLREVVKRYGVKVRILTPRGDSILQQQVAETRSYANVQYIPEELQTKISIAVFDRKSSLIIEVKDDTKNSSYDAIGLVTYSNSASTVSSYVSIFGTLWRQSELYERSQSQLQTAEDELSNMKEYLKEVLNEVSKLRNPVKS
jgi:hypothetical protein